MKKLNKQRNQIIILSVLLLIMGVANYFNYYAPAKPVENVMTFSELTSEEQEKLINSAKQHSVFAQKDNKKESTANDSAVFSEKNENYLNYAVDSNGKLVRWQKDKILVYVSPSEYRHQIYQALSRYNTVFEDCFKFYISKNYQNADIVIDVVDSFDSNQSQDSLYMAGVTNNTFSGNDRVLSKSHVQLLSVRPNSNKKVTKKELYRVAMHEIGHSIGIIGHSPNSKDILYAATGVDDFSLRDINTIKMMYSGDDELVAKVTENFAETRLAEAEKYARMSFKKAIAWVNLAKTYYDLGKKEEAINAYKKAITIEPKNPLIYQSMAECYYLSEKYDAAIQMYKQALSLSKTQYEQTPVITMLGMCYAKKENFTIAYEYFAEAFRRDSASETVLKNLLVACIQLDYKEDARNAIAQYKQVSKKNVIDNEFINDAIKWSGAN